MASSCWGCFLSSRGPQAHVAKLAFEKCFMWKMEHGYVQLP